MSPTAPLMTLVEQQRERIQALQTVLEQEASIIASRVSDDIEAIAKEKQALINEIQRNDAQISRHSERDSLHYDETMREHISAIQTCLSTCKQQNETNGVALQRASLSIHRLRNLFQESGGKSELTYNQDGNASGRKTLGTNIKA